MERIGLGNCVIVVVSDTYLYDRIRDKVSGLTSTLKDMNTLTPEMHQKADFSHLYDATEKRMKESPAAPEYGVKSATESNAVPKLTGNVTADHGSIAFGGDSSGQKGRRRYCDRESKFGK
jgi:hypothetical protein